MKYWIVFLVFVTFNMATPGFCKVPNVFYWLFIIIIINFYYLQCKEIGELCVGDSYCCSKTCEDFGRDDGLKECHVTGELHKK